MQLRRLVRGARHCLPSIWVDDDRRRDECGNRIVVERFFHAHELDIRDVDSTGHLRPVDVPNTHQLLVSIRCYYNDDDDDGDD